MFKQYERTRNLMLRKKEKRVIPFCKTFDIKDFLDFRDKISTLVILGSLLDVCLSSQFT